MNYVKKVCVLKQLDKNFSLPNKSLGGIVRLEQESGVTTLFCSIIDVALLSAGEFFLFIYDCNKKIFSLPLGKRPSSFTRALDFDLEINNGFATGLCFIANDLPTLVAFGMTDGFNLTAKEFKKYVAEKCLLMRKSKQQKDLLQQDIPSDITSTKQYASSDMPSDITSTHQDMPSTLPSTQQGITCDITSNIPSAQQESASSFDYNDEAVATENYYDLDDGIREKLSIIEDLEYERLRTENGKPTSRGKKEKEQGKNNGNRTKNETDDCYGKEYSVGFDSATKASLASADEKPKTPFDEQNPYFFYAGNELDNLFDKFPEDLSLKGVFPASKWVKINYSPDKFYVVGVIYSLDGDTSQKKPQYICYGVPEKYSSTPPQALKDYCSFVPTSLFDLHGDGFWMMFQDAITGDCVKMSGKK